jgi:hypothetical protein
VRERREREEEVRVAMMTLKSGKSSLPLVCSVERE